MGESWTRAKVPGPEPRHEFLVGYLLLHHINSIYLLPFLVSLQGILFNRRGEDLC
jgi:hypothetical protein